MFRNEYVLQNILNSDVKNEIMSFAQSPFEEARTFYTANLLNHFKKNVSDTIYNEYRYPIHVGFAKRTLEILKLYKNNTFSLDKLFNDNYHLSVRQIIDLQYLQTLKKQRKLHIVGLVPFQREKLMIQIRLKSIKVRLFHI